MVKSPGEDQRRDRNPAVVAFHDTACSGKPAASSECIVAFACMHPCIFGGLHRSVWLCLRVLDACSQARRQEQDRDTSMQPVLQSLSHPDAGDKLSHVSVFPPPVISETHWSNLFAPCILSPSFPVLSTAWPYVSWCVSLCTFAARSGRTLGVFVAIVTCRHHLQVLQFCQGCLAGFSS